ncbi:calcium-binding protein [Mycoplana ramosa]|uniref:Calcium-binding protein n=1 Tax=Mycoplana ramosa TaxID=40837 RepID=A0ABW3YTR8_MYCRA
MIIKAKGTKTDSKEASASQRYLLESMDRPAHGPKVIAWLLVGTALYLMSMMSAWLTQPRAERKARGDDLPADPANEMMEAGDQMSPQSEEERPDTEVITGSILPNSWAGGGQVIELLGRGRLLPLAMDPVPNYLLPELPLTWRDPSLPSAPARPANDNMVDGGTGPTPGIKPTPDGSDAVDDDKGGDGDPPTDSDNDDDKEETDPPSSNDNDDNDDDDSGNDNSDDDGERVNRAPRLSGPVQLMDVTSCIAFAISIADLLRNAHDPDGDTLSIRNVQISSGSLAASAEGWIFQATPRLEGPITITYEVTDGALSVVQTAHFAVVGENLIIGTDADDRVLGSTCRDTIDGGAGDDNIDARSGDDTIFGGTGNDHILAGSGNDSVFGGSGHDVIFGGSGSDWLSGGDGNDRIFGEEGDDTLFGDAGDDVLFGGKGNDLIIGGLGNDTAYGDDGNDRMDGEEGDDILDGGEGDDVIRGGNGNDQIRDGAGRDVVHGGAGNDTVVAAIDGDDDHYDGGDGRDTLDYSESQQGVVIDLVDGSASGSEIGNDAIVGFEIAMGGAGADTLIGGDGDEILYGNGGGDLIHDGAGRDIVYGGAGDDTVVAALDGDDDRYDGGAGCDTIDYSATTQGVAIDLVCGTASGIEIGDDTITGFEIAIGGVGDDYFRAGAGAPAVLAGGGGNNTFEFTPVAAPTVFEITDFKAGDKVKLKKYDIFEKVFDKFEDEFEKIYGDKVDDDDARIRFRSEYNAETGTDTTVIEADFNRDDIYETTIFLNGRHVLVIVEAIA